MIGANPLESATLAAENCFVVVQDMFLTETAQRADVVLPSASAYEKSGTVTNASGEVQRLKPGPKVMGVKSDLEIIGLIGKEMGLEMGIWSADKVFEEIRRTVRGYNVALPVIATGGAAPTSAGEWSGARRLAARADPGQRRYPVYFGHARPLFKSSQIGDGSAGGAL